MAADILRRMLKQPEPVHHGDRSDLAETLCKAAALSGLMQLSIAVEATAGSIQNTTPAGFIDNLWPEALNLTVTASVGQTGLLSINAELANAIGDILTGDLSDTENGPPRPPTATDASLCRGFVNGLLAEFAGLMADRAPPAPVFEFLSVDPDPSAHSFADIAYLSTTLSLDFAEGTRRGKLMLNLPAVDLLCQNDSPAENSVDPRWKSDMRAAVNSTRASLQSVLHRKQMPIAQVMRLKPGDTLSIPASALENLSLESGNNRLITARLGEYQEMRAAKITDFNGSTPAKQQPLITP